MTDEEFNTFLTDISCCLISKDFQLWADRVELPFSIVTATGPNVSHTLEALRVQFDLYVQACENMNLDMVYRTPLSCEHCEDGTVIGTYRTELLCHGQRMTEPFTSSALLKNAGGVWRMTAILNARGHAGWSAQPQPDTKPKCPDDAHS